MKCVDFMFKTMLVNTFPTIVQHDLVSIYGVQRDQGDIDHAQTPASAGHGGAVETSSDSLHRWH